MPQAIATLVFVLMVSAAAGQPPPIKLPAEVRGLPSAFVTVRAETEGKTVRWFAMTPGLSVFPSELLRDTKATVVVAGVPGRYTLLAYTAKGDEPSELARCEIIIEGPAPPPPDPPGPKPPDPTDPLAKKIRDALASDPGTAAQKREWAAALGGFYAAMAKHVATDQAATVGDLLSDYRNAIPAVLPADAIPATRRVAGQEVAAIAGEDPERKIDQVLKGKLVDLFTRLSAAMTQEAKR